MSRADSDLVHKGVDEFKGLAVILIGVDREQRVRIAGNHFGGFSPFLVQAEDMLSGVEGEAYFVADSM